MCDLWPLTTFCACLPLLLSVFLSLHQLFFFLFCSFSPFLSVRLTLNLSYLMRQGLSSCGERGHCPWHTCAHTHIYTCRDKHTDIVSTHAYTCRHAHIYADKRTNPHHHSHTHAHAHTHTDPEIPSLLCRTSVSWWWSWLCSYPQQAHNSLVDICL